jgi:hypothetical protein
MEIATAVVSMTGKDWDYVLWDMPAAVAIQLHLLYWQRQGWDVVKDNSDDIRRRLANG